MLKKLLATLELRDTRIQTRVVKNYEQALDMIFTSTPRVAVLTLTTPDGTIVGERKLLYPSYKYERWMNDPIVKHAFTVGFPEPPAPPKPIIDPSAFDVPPDPDDLTF